MELSIAGWQCSVLLVGRASLAWVAAGDWRRRRLHLQRMHVCDWVRGASSSLPLASALSFSPDTRTTRSTLYSSQAASHRLASIHPSLAPDSKERAASKEMAASGPSGSSYSEMQHHEDGVDYGDDDDNSHEMTEEDKVGSNYSLLERCRLGEDRAEQG